MHFLELAIQKQLSTALNLVQHHQVSVDCTEWVRTTAKEKSTWLIHWEDDIAIILDCDYWAIQLILQLTWVPSSNGVWENGKEARDDVERIHQNHAYN